MDPMVEKFRKTRKMKHAVGATRSQLKTEPSAKCNSVKLKKIMHQKMSFSATISKQMIYSAAVMTYPRRIVNVICSRHSFSYIVVTSPIYCEHRKARLTCFTFLQP
ncbi:ground-like domain protein [Ancylostoma caninum]|uniref:Ground-like domain protein n=1 Tax=Ancylostoma caninum TaxID=29170 RepID=A0A368H609_ANCCA|nr:ground-like domain protein [Ancylostoma caninum]